MSHRRPISRLTRRQFVAGAVAGVAGAAAMTLPTARVRGANDDIRVAVIGFNGKGGHHISIVRNLPGVRLVALCDADKDVLAKGVKGVDGAEGYTDMRKVFDRKDIDAIITATPNHWHALTAIWAMQSGKDVYVEKPVSHNVWEGRKIVETARKYGRICQTGTQSRSDRGNHEVIAYIREGHIGKLLRVRGFCYKRRKSIGKVDGVQNWPANIDRELWTGPSALVDLKRKSVHYDWHWDFETGNGDIGNQGIHEMDLCRWGAGHSTLPPRVMSIGGRFGYVDDGNTPNTQISILAYPDVPIIFEVQGLGAKGQQDDASPNFRGVRVGVVYECEGGYFAGKDGGWIYDNNHNKIKQFKGGGAGDHQQNFFNACRSRKVEDLSADILEGHLSSALCHLGNISHRLGKESSQDEIREVIKSDAVAMECMDRFEEHLKTNNVDFKQTPRVLGPWLEFDPKTEQFTGNGYKSRANELLTRQYRKPFIVPDQV